MGLEEGERRYRSKYICKYEGELKEREGEGEKERERKGGREEEREKERWFLLSLQPPFQPWSQSDHLAAAESRP